MLLPGLHAFVSGTPIANAIFMQTTLNTSIAAMMCDNLQSDGGDRSKAASAFDGEGTPRRFADVLPVAQAALETSSEQQQEVEDDTQDESSDVQTDEELTAVSADRRQAEVELASIEAAGWPFAGVLQPDLVEIPADGQTVVSSVEPGPQAAEQMSASETVAIQTGVQTQSQDPVDTGFVNVSLGDDVAADRVAASPQTASSPGIMGDSASSMTQVGEGTSSPVSSGSEETLSAWQLMQESTAKGTQVVQPDAADMKFGSTCERAQTPVPGVGDSALPADELDISQLLDSTSGSPQDAAAEGTEQMLDEPQPATMQMSAGSDKGDSRPMPSGEEESGDASGLFKTVSTESATAETTQSVAKGTSTSGAGDAGAMPLEQSVSVAAEAATRPQRPITQTGPQVNGDASVVRSSAQSIGEQILDSVQVSAARGDRQILVRLNPPELGNVLVRFQEHDHILTGTLEVSNGQTRREIEQILPQVARTLQEAGVQIRRIEVVASDHFDKDTGREDPAQDAWSQRQEGDQNREQSYASPQSRWSRGPGGSGVIRGGTRETQSQAAAAQGGIDLLL